MSRSGARRTSFALIKRFVAIASLPVRRARRAPLLVFGVAFTSGSLILDLFLVWFRFGPDYRPDLQQDGSKE